MPGDTNAPVDHSALVAAVEWPRDLVTGTFGITLAVLAIAWLGFAALQGRLPVRDGIRIVIACFILFGASLIAQGLSSLAQASAGPTEAYSAPATAPVVLPSQPPKFDPYARASVPEQ